MGATALTSAMQTATNDFFAKIFETEGFYIYPEPQGLFKLVSVKKPDVFIRVSGINLR
ncbi:MAG: hypothetical protein N4A49_06075 [Marinifilaceae bacterium]|nr:hypothetical protein [Marinifilaceae bacterium]